MTTLTRHPTRNGGHGYMLDGREVPGVTTLIGGGVPKPALVQWAATETARYAVDNLDILTAMDADAAFDLLAGARYRTNKRATSKGTLVHALAEQIITGHTVDVTEDLVPYVDGFLRFMEDWVAEAIAVEASVASVRWQYAGTIDLLVTLKGGMVSLVDIKTGKRVYPEACLQIAAYRNADVILRDGEVEPMPATDAGHVVFLPGDGTYELMPVASGPDIFSVFLHAAHVAAFQKRANDQGSALIGLPLAASA